LEFYNDYGMFFREGIVTTPDQNEREEISKLLRFESSAKSPGEVCSLEDYISRMKAGERNIYYFCAPSRQLAESSPYMEALKAQEKEVLFCYENYDELVLMNLAQFDKKNLKSIDNEIFEDTSTAQKSSEEVGKSLSQTEAENLLGWLQVTLGNRVQKTKVTSRLDSHPCVITVTEMVAARHFLRTTLADKSNEERSRILQPTMEINPKHPIIRKLYTLKDSDDKLAKLVAEQIYDNAMIAAGLIDDPRSMLTRMNDLLTRALDKH
jgi:TNF receptor-associated protein 1